MNARGNHPWKDWHCSGEVIDPLSTLVESYAPNHQAPSLEISHRPGITGPKVTRSRTVQEGMAYAG
jgi:hypothetical protein